MTLMKNKFKTLLIAVVLVAAIIVQGVAIAPALASPQDFIDKMAPVAQEIVPQYGLWTSVFLAQAALESGWGKSWLAQNANNYFGRKCGYSPCVESLTSEFRNGQWVREKHYFQAYGTINEAIHDYAQKFFRKWPDGTPVYNMDASTPETFIRSIAPRYATDPNYAAKVLAIIREWDLTKYDLN